MRQNWTCSESRIGLARAAELPPTVQAAAGASLRQLDFDADETWLINAGPG
jgi:hypothetical protein